MNAWVMASIVALSALGTGCGELDRFSGRSKSSSALFAVGESSGSEDAGADSGACLLLHGGKSSKKTGDGYGNSEDESQGDPSDGKDCDDEKGDAGDKSKDCDDGAKGDADGKDCDDAKSDDGDKGKDCDDDEKSDDGDKGKDCDDEKSDSDTKGRRDKDCDDDGDAKKPL